MKFRTVSGVYQRYDWATEKRNGLDSCFVRCYRFACQNGSSPRPGEIGALLPGHGRAVLLPHREATSRPAFLAEMIDTSRKISETRSKKTVR